MKTSACLNVWYGQELVGRIEQDISGMMAFCYQQDWLAHGFPVSQQLPLLPEIYSASEGKAHCFFANLLPEANARLHIVKDLKIADDDFELLRVIGGECAGAFSILPPELTPDTKASYKKLNDAIFQTVLLRKGNANEFFTEGRFRLSLAGAQDKLPVFIENGEYFIPIGASPSTHIIKFDIPDYKNIPIYECFLTDLAKKIGLPVAECVLKNKCRNYFLLVKRYDRILTENREIRRLHQEDFCQALGYFSRRKYQGGGGPSFSDCYQLTQKISSNPIFDAENLLKWQIFNFLAGNSDGHAKNLSFVYNEKHQPILAPFYDLVCTRAIARIDTRLAFSIGGEFDPGKITIQHWIKLAQACDVRELYLKELLRDVAEQLLQNISVVRTRFERQYGPCPALQRVQQVVTKQCKKVIIQINKS